MAWSYMQTFVPSSTITSTTNSYAETNERSFLETSTNATRTATSQSTANSQGIARGTWGYYGTGAHTRSYATDTQSTTTVTDWHGTTTLSGAVSTVSVVAFQSWDLRSGSFTSSNNATATFGESDVQLRPGHALNTADHLETSYRTISFSTFYSYQYVDERFIGGSLTSGETLRTYLTRSHIEYAGTAGDTGVWTTTQSGETSNSTVESLVANTWTYPSSTAVGTIPGTSTSTTSATVTFTYSAFTVDVTTPTTTTASSTATVSAAATTTYSSSVTEQVLGTFVGYPLINTIVHADSTDWVWKFTSTGAGSVPAFGVSVTDSTIAPEGVGKVASTWTPVSVSYTYSNGSYPTVEIVETYFETGTSSDTFTRRTTSSSSYEIGSPTTGEANIPLTARSTVTRYFSTTTGTTYTFHTVESTTYSYDDESWVPALTFAYTYEGTLSSTQSGDVPTYTTTYLAGSYPDSNYPEAKSVFMTSTYGDASRGGTTHATTVESRKEYDRRNPEAYLSDDKNRGFSVGAPATISFVEPAVAGGFQAWTNVAVGTDYGTNLSANQAVAIVSWGQIYPNVIVPLMDSATRAFTAGSTTFGTTTVSGTTTTGTTLTSGSAMTSQYLSSVNQVRLTTIQLTGGTTSLTVEVSTVGAVPNDRASMRSDRSTVGGHGWKRSVTDATQVSARGLHRFTSQNSTGGTLTSTCDWVPSSSTRDISHANAIAFETVPKADVWSTYLTSANPVLVTFAAFPET